VPRRPRGTLPDFAPGDAAPDPAQPVQLTADGWVDVARRVPSVNADDRPDGCPISLIVLHNISLPPGEFGGPDIEALFTNLLDLSRHPFYAELEGLRVSSHLLVRRDGEIIQFVPLHQRAWHAGVSRWKERERCNDFSIGIELEGTDSTPYTDTQYERAARLAQLLSARFPIEDIVGHSDIAPERKSDPGPAFDWARFRALLRR
jgi:AmpD protein